MLLSSQLALIKSARLLRSGQPAKAEQVLMKAVDNGSCDPRLLIRLALVSGDFERLRGLSDPTAILLLALDSYRRGDVETAEKLLDDIKKTRLSGAPSYKAFSALIRFRKDGDIKILRDTAMDITHATGDIQALTLLELEQAIIATNKKDTGADSADTPLKGPAGWILDRLDDFAVWVYWLISIALNWTQNLADAKKRAVYRLVIEGDRLDGLRKQKQARRFFKQALELYPNNEEALESMVIYSLQDKDIASAGKYLDILWRQAEGDPQAIWIKWKADCLFLKQEYASSEILYEKAEEDFRLDYMIPYRIGLCRLRQGDKEGAVENFKTALGLINHGLIETLLAEGRHCDG